MKIRKHSKLEAIIASTLLLFSSLSFANCDDLPSHSELAAALKASVNASGGPSNGGFNLNMWATLVDRDGIVCAIAMTGDDRGDQWPGSRIISAQKANTANAFSLPGLAISTANLFSAVQPGGSLFGLQFSNPVDTNVAYGQTGPGGTNAKNYGTENDPLTHKIIGGINVFGGGLALYNSEGTLLGALGVSGDSSCADHNIAWRTRDGLGLDYVPAGPGNLFGGTVGDNIIYDVVGGVSASGFGHPECGGTEPAVNAIIVVDHPLGS